jgi:ATP-binding cassette, subfamily C (CFTR/MRP), member 1
LVLKLTTVYFFPQTLLAFTIADVIVQLAIQIINYPNIWFADFRVLTTFGTIVSLFVIFAIQWLEHTRLRNANGVVLFYWLFLLISYSVKLRSLISQQIYGSNLPYFVTYTIGFGLSTLTFLVEWLWPRKNSTYEALIDEDECPVEYATIFSRVAFSWMTPLMQHGYRQYLTEDDLWGLAKKDQTVNTGDAFEKAWNYQLKNRKNPSLWLALFHAYGGPYAFAAIFKIGNDITQYMQPQLLRYLIAYVASHRLGNPQPAVWGGSIALGMFVVAIFQTIMIVSNL